MFKVATQDKKALSLEIRQQVVEVLRELISDPDFGLELTEKAKKRLRTARRIKKGIPLAEIIKKYY